MSTGSGLSYVHINDLHPDSVSFGSFNKDSVSFPRGGAPALAVRENIIVISGLLDTTAVTGEELMGTGISYSIDSGENWIFLSQPIDTIPETGKYQTILWGEQEISALAVTITGFLPPSSAIKGRGSIVLNLLYAVNPTSLDPVKTTPLTYSFLIISTPTVLPGPVR